MPKTLEISIKVYKILDSDLENEISLFRKNNAGMQGRKKTKAEIKVHRDKYWSGKDVAYWIIAFERKNIVGMAVIYKRKLNLNGKKILLGGIGRLRVAMNKRKQGIGNIIMNFAMMQLSKINCDVVLLCTDTQSFLVTWYEKFGFALMSKTITYLGESGKRYSDNRGMLAPIKSEEIFSQIQNNKEILNIGNGNW